MDSKRGFWNCNSTYFYSERHISNTKASGHSVGILCTEPFSAFLGIFLETIYKSYAPDINSSRVSPEIDSMTFLENIRDFFQSKGSKLRNQGTFQASVRRK